MDYIVYARDAQTMSCTCYGAGSVLCEYYCEFDCTIYCEIKAGCPVRCSSYSICPPEQVVSHV